MKTLFIRILDPETQDITWTLIPPAKGEDSSVKHGSLSDVAKHAEGNRVVLLIPGTDVLLTHTSIPTSNKQRLLKAIPYTFENQILDDVETQHFAIGARDKSGNIPVAIIRKSTIEALIDLLQQNNIHANIITPDTLTLPWIPKSWTILRENNLCLIRTSESGGFSIESENLGELVQASTGDDTEQTDEQPPENIKIINHGNKDDDIEEISGLDIENKWQAEHYENDPLTLMAEAFNPANCINLLQGKYSPRSQLVKNLRPWIPAAALFVIWISLQGIIDVTNYVTMGKESKAISREIEKVFRDELPEIKRIVNPRAQMKQQLAKLKKSKGSEGDSFLDLLSLTSPAFTNQNVKELKNINYRGNQLDIELIINNLQNLDGLKQELETRGLKIEIRSATANKNNVTSRLRITREKS
ncbi:MAG: hypothetical protein KAS48_00020 [Gammaproteobacteria bacterium]|nr:hypothetical protein [Gammaproteobacteria bacterium]